MPRKRGTEHHQWKHGMRHSRLYTTWTNMLSRCTYESVKCFERYGGKGISVCEQWHTFKPFADWALANGYDDTLTIDRIDPDGDYEPTNCQFITRAQNNARRRAGRPVVNEKGERFKTSTLAAKAYSRDPSKIRRAIALGRRCAGLLWREAA